MQTAKQQKNNLKPPIDPFSLPIELITWRPREGLSIAEWTEKKRILSADSEERGPMRLKRTPYLKPIMDDFENPDYEEFVICKAAQIGLTQGCISIVGYYADQDPCPIMFVLADEDTAKYMMRIRLAPMFQESPELEHLAGSKFHQTEIHLINGTYIAMAWASSVAKLASRPIRLLFLDEIDKPGYYLTTKEAGPISLARERTETFYNRRIVLLSTPTVETGNISTELASCDVIFDFHVPCPFCGQFQPLRFSPEYSTGFPDGVYWDQNGDPQPLGQVVWQGGRHATPEQIEAAGYRCGSCEQIFDTVQKNNAVERGKMIARKMPAYKPRKVGYHINRLYSLLGKSGDFAEIVRNWINSFSDPKKLQGFVNSTLAEFWKLTVIKSTEDQVLKARVDLDPQTVPGEAVALTAGIDPQKYGFWFTVRAWAKDYSSWLIHYGFLTHWNEVEELLFNSSYPIAGSDKSMRIWRACIDTGGGKGEHDFDPTQTEQSYWWIRSNAVGRGCYVYGCKGSARPLSGKIHIGKVLDKTPSGQPLPGGIRLIFVDTDQVKDMYHFRLQNAIEGDSQPAYLHKETGADYARQILAEEKIINERGLQVWHAVRRDNHFLDCECLAMIAADPEFVGGGINILAHAEQVRTKKLRRQVEQKKNRREKEDWRNRRPNWLER